MLTFKSIFDYQPGILAEIIHKSYAEIVNSSPEYWLKESEKWDEFDKESFESPETVGKCVFVTCLDNFSIGLGSFDPRQAPEFGIVGQNCILPEYRGRGFGKQQLLEILRRFKEQKFAKVRATTNEHPFFVPAQNMYLSVGFKETKRFVDGPDPRYKMIEFEREL